MNRRYFLASTMGAGMMAAAGSRASGAADSELALQQDIADLTKANIPTPALVVDLDALEANLQKMADHCRKAGCSLRPHGKTHKCPEIARRQIAAGAVGLCVATVPEAEAMAAAGIGGLLLTSPIVEPHKIARIVALARGGEIMLAVGHPRQAELLDEAAAAAQVTLDVLIDVDVGDRRTGVLPGEPAVVLARQIGRCKNLHMRGVQAYSGRASHTVGFAERQRVSREAIIHAAETQALLRRAGLETEILSGGSTGTYNIDPAIEGFTELQAGSYIFMDVDYRRIGGRDGQPVYDDFQPSLTVVTTVVSATHADRVTVDAGTKAIDTTTPYQPQSQGQPELVYARAGDEFGTVTVEEGGSLPAIGQRVEFLVPHCDPSINLYDRLYACRGEKVQEIWPIAARREFVPT